MELEREPENLQTQWLFELDHAARDRIPVLDFLHLEIGWTNLFVSVLYPQRGVPLMDITHLRTLLCNKSVDDTAIETLIPILGANRSLEHLQLGSTIYERGSIDISLVPTLRSMSFSSVMQTPLTPFTFHDPVSWIVSIFARITSPYPLEEINISVYWAKMRFHDDADVDWTRWKGLDLVLNSPNFSRLRKVDICLYVGDAVFDRLPANAREAKRLEDVLPNLRERGILCVHGYETPSRSYRERRRLP